MRLLSFAGVTFESLGLGAGTPDGDWEGPSIDSIDLSRRGYSPVHIGAARGAKAIQIVCAPKPGVTVEAAILNVLGAFDPYDETERPLYGMLNDGTPVFVYAALGQYRGTPQNTVVFTYTIADPIWRKTTPDTFGPVTWPAAGRVSLSTPNLGKARANLLLTITPTSNSAGADFQFRRSFTITNNSDQPLRRHPLEIALGDTTAWGGSDTNRLHTHLLLDGIIQPNTIIGWRTAYTTMWLVVDELRPGGSLTYDIAWSRTSSNSPQLTGLDAPAFDLSWDTGTSSGANTSTTLNDTSKAWEPSQWVRGSVRILTGPGAGEEITIGASTATQVSLISPWTTTPTSASTYELRMSRNTRWVYSVRQTERSGAEDKRGNWYLNRGQSRPSRAIFDVPGGWYRILSLDNNDEKNQSRWCPVTIGGTADYFAILDCDRTVQGWTRLQEEGQADGIAFSSPLPISAFRFNYQLKNPNGIGRGWFGCRESGAEDWELVTEQTAATDTLTAYSLLDYAFPNAIHHLIAAIGPRNEEAMPTTWIRDTGTRTSGGSVTFFDDSKEWTAGQWVNATLRIISGKGQGQARKVISSGVDQLNLASAWTVIPGDDSRYEVVNKVLVATLRALDTWEVRLDSSLIAVSAIGAEVTNYDIQGQIGLGGDPFGTGPAQVVTIGNAGPLGSRRVMTASGQEIRIDGRTRRAALYTMATGAFVRDVTSAVTVSTVDPVGGSKLALDWLVVPPQTANLVPNSDFADGTVSGWGIVGTPPAGVTQAISYDAAVYHLAAGSLKLAITASTAASGTQVIYGYPGTAAYLPVTAGQAVTVTAWVRTASANWWPRVGIAWYTAGNVQISMSIMAYGPPTAATWQHVAHQAVAPANAVTAQMLLVGYQQTASSTDTLNFDEVIFGDTALICQVPFNAVNTTVTAQLTEGWHG